MRTFLKYFIMMSMAVGMAMAAGGDSAAAASPEARCQNEGGRYQWDGVGLRYCCMKRVFWEAHGRHFPARPAWCINS